MSSIEALKMQLMTTAAAIDDNPAAKAELEALLAKLQALAPRPKTGAVGAAPAAAAEINEEIALEAFRTALKARGTHGIISLGKKFKSMDDNGNGFLAYDEFKKACKEMKLDLTEQDFMRAFRAFDRDISGHISFDELLHGLRGTLEGRRLEMVKMAFKVLDRAGDLEVSLEDVGKMYDAKTHPDVVSGAKTVDQVLTEFMFAFEEEGTKDGKITEKEFISYYGYVSASVDNDDYFELMIRNAWHISGGEGWTMNTTCKRVLVTLTDGAQKVVEVENDIGLDTKNTAAVKARLIEQGLTNIKSVALYGDMTGSSLSVPGTAAPRTSLSTAAPPRTSLTGAPGTPSRPMSRATTAAMRNASSISFG